MNTVHSYFWLFLGPLLTKNFSSVMKSIKPKIQHYHKFPPLVITISHINVINTEYKTWKTHNMAYRTHLRANRGLTEAK